MSTNPKIQLSILLWIKIGSKKPPNPEPSRDETEPSCSENGSRICSAGGNRSHAKTLPCTNPTSRGSAHGGWEGGHHAVAEWGVLVVAADEVREAELHGEEEDGEEDGLRDPESRQHRRRAGDLWGKGDGRDVCETPGMGEGE